MPFALATTGFRAALLVAVLAGASLCGEDPSSYLARIPALTTDRPEVNSAYRIAVGDLLGNVAPHRSGLLDKPVPVILAGLAYPTPWTRDASVNAWNGASLLIPSVSRNTLLAVVEPTADGPRIIGADQYWDSIVWVTGAWHHYLYTGDREFLRTALQATRNSLRFYEETEFDASDGLFRGPGWSDGVAGYPIEYADAGGRSGINQWPRSNPGKASRPGFGIPMKALSTNCLYYNAYVLAQEMAAELGLPAETTWRHKADHLREAINRHLWSEEHKHYRFLTGPFGPSEHQEALGHAYALLFGIARQDRAQLVFDHQHIAPAGVPCLWPNLERYQSPDGASFGRHAGTVWPQIQGMWAQAAAVNRKDAVFGHELLQLAAHAVRDNQFAEIYHPISGEIYGGLQERLGKGIGLWRSQPRQSWAATAFLRMIYFGLLGMRVSRDGIRFDPCVPAGISRVELRGLWIRDRQVDVDVRGKGVRVRKAVVSGVEIPADAVIPWDSWGQRELRVAIDVE